MADSTGKSSSKNVSSVIKEKKRTRVQFSCTACRTRKLKCCRSYPCANCKKRGEAASCAFVGRGPRSRISHVQANSSHIQDRLQHLENLILSFTRKQADEQSQSSSDPAQQVIPSRTAGSDIQGVLKAPLPVSDSRVKEAGSDTTARLVVKDAGTSYFDGAHWRAILEQVNEVKDYFQENEEESEQEFSDDDHPETSSSVLLLGMNKPASQGELLADIPARPVTDRLVSRFLHCKEAFMIVIHSPTFQKEYAQFWEDPHSVSFPWLALLYSILTLSVSILRAIEDPLPQSLGGHVEAMNRFQKRTVQCLVQANYITPGRYKVEALFLYTIGEFMRSQDAQLGVSFLLGLTMKLAMRMGYHRDSRQFSRISAFEGEMRRRLWAIVNQLDILVSFQVGLPRTSQAWQHDAELPWNLCDEDFNEHTEQLPPSRPETERTPVLYVRAKGRIMSVFGRISDLAHSREPVTYEQTLEIDRHLEEAHNQIPPILRVKPMEQSVADSSDLIMNRFTLESLYLKCRCVLHRRYLAEVHNNIRYTYSRWACMTAAKEILRHQAALYHETQPGGQLYRGRQFPNSIQTTDYLLASMIICLELSLSQPEPRPDDVNNDVAVMIQGREDLLKALETSHQIFKDLRLRSADAQKAHAAMTIMLRRVKNDLEAPQPVGDLVDPPSVQGLDDSNDISPPSYNSWHYTQNPSSTLVQEQIDPVQQQPFGSLDVIEEMLDAPTTIDWRLWDQQFHGFEDKNTAGL